MSSSFSPLSLEARNSLIAILSGLTPVDGELLVPGVGLVKEVKSPTPSGDLPYDLSVAMTTAGKVSNVVPDELERINVSPPDFILKLVCNFVLSEVLFFSEAQIKRYSLASIVILGNVHLVRLSV